MEFQRYLLDQIPPLTASDAVQTLMEQPPQLMIKQVHAWAVEQGRLQDASMSDFLFHALKKVYLFASLKLIDRIAVERYLNSVFPLAMEICPPEERDLLRKNLIALRDSADLLASSTQGAGWSGGSKAPAMTSRPSRRARSARARCSGRWGCRRRT